MAFATYMRKICEMIPAGDGASLDEPGWPSGMQLMIGDVGRSCMTDSWRVDINRYRSGIERLGLASIIEDFRRTRLCTHQDGARAFYVHRQPTATRQYHAAPSVADG